MPHSKTLHLCQATPLPPKKCGILRYIALLCAVRMVENLDLRGGQRITLVNGIVAYLRGWPYIK